MSKYLAIETIVALPALVNLFCFALNIGLNAALVSHYGFIVRLSAGKRVHQLARGARTPQLGFV